MEWHSGTPCCWWPKWVCCYLRLWQILLFWWIRRQEPPFLNFLFERRLMDLDECRVFEVRSYSPRSDRRRKYVHDHWRSRYPTKRSLPFEQWQVHLRTKILQFSRIRPHSTFIPDEWQLRKLLEKNICQNFQSTSKIHFVPDNCYSWRCTEHFWKTYRPWDRKDWNWQGSGVHTKRSNEFIITAHKLQGSMILPK